MRGSRTAGKPSTKPVPSRYETPIGLHPADQSGYRDEARRVRELRARNVPWAHVARMIGKNEQSLRSAYENLPVLTEAVKPPVVAAPREGALTLAERLLMAIDDQPGASTARLADICMTVSSNASEGLRRLRDRRLAHNLTPGKNRLATWMLTPSGRAKVALIKTRREG
jgi:hypothetical protein